MRFDTLYVDRWFFCFSLPSVNLAFLVICLMVWYLYCALWHKCEYAYNILGLLHFFPSCGVNMFHFVYFYFIHLFCVMVRFGSAISSICVLRYLCTSLLCWCALLACAYDFLAEKRAQQKNVNISLWCFYIYNACLYLRSKYGISILVLVTMKRVDSQAHIQQR